MNMIVAADLMAGTAPAIPIRLQNLCRLCGVSLYRREELRSWLEARLDYLDGPPTTGPLVDRPLAGCWDLAAAAAVLRADPPDCCHFLHGRTVPGIETILPCLRGPQHNPPPPAAAGRRR